MTDLPFTYFYVISTCITCGYSNCSGHVDLIVLTEISSHVKAVLNTLQTPARTVWPKHKRKWTTGSIFANFMRIRPMDHRD